MTKKAPNPNLSKGKAQVYFEYALLALCLAVIALRATFTEGPITQSITFAASLADSLYSLSVSTVLILAFALWLIWSLLGRNFIYKRTGIEIGLGIFCVGAFVAALAATDKRISMTDIAVFLTPVLMAFLLVQILDSRAKIKITLAVIAALGVISAYQCAEQFFISNQVTIEQYEQDPQSLLEPLGIEPDSFQQFLFEHRLYSKGVRGYFTTRNSAGSFALMALFAGIALFINKLKTPRSDTSDRWYLVGCGIAVAVILFSLGLTRSKGALIGLCFAAVAFFVLLFFGNWLKKHKRSILAVCLLLTIVLVTALAAYGLKHDKLPGGASMLVRWQYWHASAKIYADKPFTGIGPGNFGDFYTRYKPAAALESVADPHNFPLSILTQYGPLGLLGFLVMLLLPVWKSLGQAPAATSATTTCLKPAFRTEAVVILAVVSITLMFVRPILMPETFNESLDVTIYMIVTWHLAPAAIFVIGFLLFAGPLVKRRDTRFEIRKAHTATFVFCAVLAVVLHNLFDFAIFEPGVLTAFWAMVACFVAIDYQTNSRPVIILKPKSFMKITVAVVMLASGWAYWAYVCAPVERSTTLIRRADKARLSGRFAYAHELLDKAAGEDSLDSSALSINGRLYLREYELIANKDRDMLFKAEVCLKKAISRNNVEFKNFERLADVYRLLTEKTTGQERADLLAKAFEAASQALDRYPGSGRLNFKLAQIADLMGKVEIARRHYEKAIEIEEAYRNQFRQMYPERQDIVSRLDKNMYLYAKERIQELSGESEN